MIFFFPQNLMIEFAIKSTWEREGVHLGLLPQSVSLSNSSWHPLVKDSLMIFPKQPIFIRFSFLFFSHPLFFFPFYILDIIFIWCFFFFLLFSLFSFLKIRYCSFHIETETHPKSRCLPALKQIWCLLIV